MELVHFAVDDYIEREVRGYYATTYSCHVHVPYTNTITETINIRIHSPLYCKELMWVDCRIKVELEASFLSPIV